MSRLRGTVAFVTGAARGMGRSHCVRMAAEGADIIAVDLAPSSVDLDETALLVRNLGRRCTTSAADVRDRESLAAAVSNGVAELGRLDVIVANAGIYADLALSWELQESAWRRTVDINLTGVWHTITAAMPHLSDGGSVVIVSSTNGVKGTANTAHYSASKHAVVGLARTLANELGPRGIRVNTVHPGAVGTSMIRNPDVFANLRPDLESPSERDAVALLAAKNLLPVPWLDPIDVSNAVLFLASEESRYVTGTQLVVDAGLTQKVD